MLIANQAGALWEEIRLLETGQASAATAWLGAAAFTLQLYFDFSAYSDMAIGMGGCWVSISRRTSGIPCMRCP